MVAALNQERTQPIVRTPPGSAVLQTHRTPRRSRRLLTGASVLMWLLTVLLATIATYRWGMAALYYGPGVMLPWSGPWLLAALVSALLASALTVAAIRARRRSVHVLRSGLLLQNGGRRTHVPWNAITKIYTSAVSYRIPVLSRPRLSIELGSRSGQRVSLPPFLEGADRLLTAVKAEVYPRLMVEARQAFNSGQAVQFGPLSLDRQGVRRGEVLLPWDQLADVRLEGGRLSIEPVRGRGKRWRIAVRTIPNADLCLQVITLIQQGQS